MKKSLVITLIMLTFTSVAQAHKIRIFAYPDGNQINCEVQFSGDKPAQSAKISVYEAGKIIHTGTTNTRGLYNFPSTIANGGDLRITVSSGDGHHGEWLMKGDEYSPSAKSQESIKHLSTTAKQPVNGDKLQQIIHDELALQLAPIKRNLAALQEPGPSLQDILGGLGYIVGLAGIAAYYSARKKERKK